MLRGRQAGSLYLLLAPAQEAAEAGPKLEQTLEVRLLQRHIG